MRQCFFQSSGVVDWNVFVTIDGNCRAIMFSTSLAGQVPRPVAIIFFGIDAPVFEH
jgi:hypothetical protein